MSQVLAELGVEAPSFFERTERVNDIWKAQIAVKESDATASGT